jgi:hypothetical protein
MLQYDEPLSNFYFNFNLRRYMMSFGCAAITLAPRDGWAGSYTRPLFSST